tara:strand:+ start:581 stop:1294 length:714 start_codon:yes stop_codon:yes gene_type:complete
MTLNNKKKILCIIQARMNSKRLKGKVLKKIQGKTALEHIIERSLQVKLIDDLVVATSNNKLDDKIEEFCKRQKINCYRGDEINVLSRFYEISKKNLAKNILRLTADCPLHDPEVIDDIIKFYKENNFDYVSNSIKRTFPVGLDTEVFSFDSLEKAFFYSSDPLHREHVTLYINRKFSELNNGSFKIYNYRAKGNFSFLRWTLDTLEDLKRIRVLMRLSENSYSWLNLISKLIERNYK